MDLLSRCVTIIFIYELGLIRDWMDLPDVYILIEHGECGLAEVFTDLCMTHFLLDIM